MLLAAIATTAAIAAAAAVLMITATTSRNNNHYCSKLLLVLLLLHQLQNGLLKFRATMVNSITGTVLHRLEFDCCGVVALATAASIIPFGTIINYYQG